MLAANVWHWWIGVALFVVGILAFVVLLIGYLRTVSAQKHPGRGEMDEQRHHADL